MNPYDTKELIKAVYSTADTLQAIANTLEHIEGKLEEIGVAIQDGETNICTEIDGLRPNGK